jgi:hypothetical protein
MGPVLTTIPITRLDQADPELLEELLAVVARVASAGAFTLGHELDAFEAEFAAYCETDHAVGVSSGTEALVLALRALGIGAGDEVIVPTNSFIATAEAVSLAGATPRLVDVDPATHLLAAEAVEAAGAQGRLWEMHDAIYKMRRPPDRDGLRKLAKKLGLDAERFEHEMGGHVHAERVRQDFESGLLSGVNGTPTFYINGERYDGDAEYDELRAALERARPAPALAA